MAAPDSNSFLSAKRLAGKVAIITGGASGIGATTARLFVSHGALVAIADVQDSLGQSLAASLSPHAKFFHCDVTHEPDVAQLVASTIQHFGRLDIMFVNAAIVGPIDPLEDLDIDAFDRMCAVNLRGAVLCIKHAAKAMIPRRKGVILATASVAGALGGGGDTRRTYEEKSEMSSHGISEEFPRRPLGIWTQNKRHLFILCFAFPLRKCIAFMTSQRS